MFDGEYTHQGELCTFEVLLARFEIADAALRHIAEIVHDIDLKDEKHGRRETAGFEALVNGIAMAHREDEARPLPRPHRPTGERASDIDDVVLRVAAVDAQRVQLQ